jgi:hypothetical protein
MAIAVTSVGLSPDEPSKAACDGGNSCFVWLTANCRSTLPGLVFDAVSSLDNRSVRFPLFGSFLPSLLVGFSTTNFTRAGEPTLSWNQLRSKPQLTGEQTVQACAMAR